MAIHDQKTGNEFLKSLRVNLDAAVYKHAVLGLISHAWKRGPIVSGKALAAGSSAKGESSDPSEKVGYRDIPDFCKSATLEEISEHGYVLTPGRYVGAEDVEDDGIPFADKMATLTSELAGQFAQSANLEKAIRENMKSLGFELPVGGKK